MNVVFALPAFSQSMIANIQACSGNMDSLAVCVVCADVNGLLKA